MFGSWRASSAPNMNALPLAWSLWSIPPRASWPDMVGTTTLITCPNSWVSIIDRVHIPWHTSTIPCQMTRAVAVVAYATKLTGCVEGVADGTLGPSTRILSYYRVYSSSKSIYNPSPLIIISSTPILARFPHTSSFHNFLN
ncbi:hypothetical protein Tco_0350916 [Tanacetum coccineum]